MANQKVIDKTFLDIAQTISNLSNCVSFKIGCVVVRDNRIIVIGYNGTPKGYINCPEKFPNYNPETMREEHHKWSSKFEVHAEMNSILYAAHHGIALEKTIMYCTFQPCDNCIKHIIPAGIERIVYKDIYDKAGYTEETKELIEISKLKLEQFVK